MTSPPSTTPTQMPEPTATGIPSTPTATVLLATLTATPEPTMAETPVPPTPTQVSTPSSTGLWRGLEVADEDRCSPYDADDYRYSQSVEDRIVADMGGIIYGPYTCLLRSNHCVGLSTRQVSDSGQLFRCLVDGETS